MIEQPWNCGGECEAGWHLASYDFEDAGSYLTSPYSDGDWEPCDGLPSPAEVDAAWLAYHEYVAETGRDPLRTFALPTRWPIVRTWQVRYRRSIKGVIVTGYRRRGRGPWTLDVPAEVVEYFTLLGDETLEDVEALGHDYQRVSPLELRVTCDDVEEQPKPWSETRTRAFLRAAARKQLVNCD